VKPQGNVDGGGQGETLFRALRGSVLLVDGDEACLSSHARALLGSSYRVTRASGAEEALAILGREPVDVIVTELELHGMGGLELLDHARERRPEAVRIILTSHPSEASALSAINFEEVFRFLTKPISREMLRAAVEAALVRRGEGSDRRPKAAAPTALPRLPSRLLQRRHLVSVEEQAALRAACRDFALAPRLPLLPAGSSS
jgi:DNA-binding NtrC family response regulator